MNANKKYFSIFSFIILLFSFHAFCADLESAKALLKAGNIAQAKKEFTLLTKNPPDQAQALFYLAKIALRQGDDDEAGDLIKKARKIVPNEAEIQFYYGVVNGKIAQEASIFTALSYAKKTRKGFARAVELAPDVIKYRQALMNYHLAAPGIAGGDKDIALEQAKQIKALDLKKGLIALARVYSATEEDEAIAKLFQNLPDAVRDDPELHYIHAMYFQQSKKYQDAINIFHQVITRAADKKAFNEIKFNAYYQIGRTGVLAKSYLDEGIKNLSFFIENAPESDNLPSANWARFRRANLFELKGEKSRARQIYQQLKRKVQDKSLIKAIKKAL